MCKKIVMFLFAIAVISSLFGANQAFAQEEYEGPLTFKMLTYRNGYAVISCEKDATEVVIPETYKGRPVYEIKREAFEGCTLLTSVVIPDTVECISFYAFKDCVSLTSIVIPDSVKDIDGGAFQNCTALKDVKLSKELTMMTRIFDGCVSLESIYIPARVRSIFSDEFIDCTSLREIIVDADNPYYYSEGNCIIDRQTGVLVKGCKTSVIPDGVTAIGERAFWFVKGIDTLVIPNTVTEIGSQSFYDAEITGKLTIPGSIAVLPEDSFSSSNINELVLSEGVTTIAEDSFDGAAIKKLTLPASLESIDEDLIVQLQAYYQPPMTVYYLPGTYAEEYLKTFRSWGGVTFAQLVFNTEESETSAPVDEQDVQSENDNTYISITLVSIAVIILCTVISVTVIKKRKQK
ncbi:MAG: leucine-rich repeat domain-containing protein [Clostridia bacterium]|nr:leucine-rich repeat domain-containing protein [Clostridia bacterium]